MATEAAKLGLEKSFVLMRILPFRDAPRVYTCCQKRDLLLNRWAAETQMNLLQRNPHYKRRFGFAKRQKNKKKIYIKQDIYVPQNNFVN